MKTPDLDRHLSAAARRAGAGRRRAARPRGAGPADPDAGAGRPTTPRAARLPALPAGAAAGSAGGAVPPAERPRRGRRRRPSRWRIRWQRMRELELRLEQTREQMQQRGAPRVSLGGYVDFGFFVPQGDGSGIMRDYGNALFPQYARPVRLGVPGRPPGPHGQHARRGRRPRRRRRRRPLRQHQLARGARLHRQRGQPDARTRR